MKTKVFIFLIILIASVVRLWNLNINPPGLTPDEAALGYNAYSILKTGKDEHGKLFPVIFKSFGDYKPGLYVYASVPFVAAFGLNEWSVRLPSAISGIIIVYLIYLITKRLFGDRVGLIASLISAINPWLIQFARGAWEVNLSLLLTLLGIYFFFLALEKPRLLVASSIFFALTLISYQGAKLATLIVLLVLGIVYWHELKVSFLGSNIAVTIKSALIGILIVSPIVLSFFNGQTSRLNVFSVLSNRRPPEYLQSFLDQGDEKVGQLNYYLFHSETYNQIRGILGRYFNHFSGRFLFFDGDYSNPRHSPPNQGVFLISDLLFMLLGFYFVLKDKVSKDRLFFLLWLVLSPLPSVLSRDQVHAVRSFNMVAPLLIITSFGYYYLFGVLRNRLIKLFLVVLTLGSFIYYLDAYFIHLPKHDAKLWQYGYKSIVETITPIQSNFKKIKVQQSYVQPYIYFLFYQKYDPQKYQTQNNYINSENVSDVGLVTKLDNIEFTDIDWPRDKVNPNTLFVAEPLKIPEEESSDRNLFKVIKDIKYPNGVGAFRIIETL